MLNVGKRTARTLVLALFVFAANALVAQQANLNLEGIVRDEVTGNPVGVKMYIFTPSGKRISINSNSKDGTYLQTLAEAGPHKIALAGYNVYRKEVVVDIPASEKFKIIKQDFTVRVLVQGTEISTTPMAFTKNTAQLTDAGNKTLSDILALMKTNQAMNVVMNIAADEDRLAAAKAAGEALYQKQYADWAKATKKLKKGQTPPAEPVRPPDPEDPNKALIQERIDTLKARMRPAKNGDVRVKYVYAPFPIQSTPTPVAVTPEPPAKTNKKKGAKAAPPPEAPKANKAITMPQLVVRVGVVKDLMD